jgi:formate dehydrogenase major subunit
MFDAMDDGEMTTAYVVGENPAVSEADRSRTERLLKGLEHLVVQDITLTETAKLAHVVLPAAAGWVESEGTVTNSERRVQRVRKVLDPPGEARDDLWIVSELARRLGRHWGTLTAEDVWNEVRSLSPMHAGMSYARLEAESGIQWPCYDENHAGELFLHARLWETPVRGPKYRPPVDVLDDDFPLQLTTGRRLDSYNTGVASGEYTSPLRRTETLDLSPHDVERYGVAEGEHVRVSSRRGSVVVPVHIDPNLRPGLAFMTFHFDTPTNVLTIDAVDPKSGTAEFKATAIRVEKVEATTASANAAGILATIPGAGSST